MPHVNTVMTELTLQALSNLCTGCHCLSRIWVSCKCGKTAICTKKANTETLISLSVSHRPAYTEKYHKAKRERDASSMHHLLQPANFYKLNIYCVFTFRGRDGKEAHDGFSIRKKIIKMKTFGNYVRFNT